MTICIPLEEYQALKRKEKRCKKLSKALRIEYNRRVFLDSSLKNIAKGDKYAFEGKRRIWEK